MGDNILKEFDSLVNAKKTNATLTKLVLIFALIVVIAILFWGFLIHQNSLNKVIVIDRSGEYVKTVVEDNEKLFISLMKTTCSQLTNYANSFNRLTIKENQTKAMFLCNTDDLQQIFKVYDQDKCYHEAIERGVVYKCEFENLVELTGNNAPYNVVFTSILSIVDGEYTTKFRITSKGSMIKTTPQFPENTTGFFFNNYLQTLEQIP